MIFSLHQGGLVMSSQITHTIINIHPVAYILDICALIFSSCVTFYSSSQPHHVTTRTREGSPKEHRAKQKLPRETHSVTYVPGLSTLFDLSRIDAQPPVISLLAKATFTPSIHPNLGLPRTRSPLTSTINTLLDI